METQPHLEKVTQLKNKKRKKKKKIYRRSRAIIRIDKNVIEQFLVTLKDICKGNTSENGDTTE